LRTRGGGGTGRCKFVRNKEGLEQAGEISEQLIGEMGVKKEGN